MIMQRVYVHDVVVRILHWTIFFCVLTLIFTGLDISHPFLTVPSASGERFVTGTVRVIHFWAAMVFDVAFFARIVWMFMGPPFARWTEFIPTTKERWRSVVESFKFYVFLRRTPPQEVGYDGFDGMIFVVRFVVDVLIIATGFALYSSITSHSSPLALFSFLVPVFGGFQNARWLHHIMMWLMIAFIIQHIIRVVSLSKIRCDSTVDSMFTGCKYVPQEIVEQHAARH